jgi:ubiquinone/menaquinone biosynthesis C-methylase UbiE
MQRNPDKNEARLIQSCLTSANGYVLEVGCGDGRLTSDLTWPGDGLIALDSWVPGLEQVKTACDASILAVAARGESLPLKDNRVDMVMFTLSLHHQDPQQALSEARRVLNPCGRILVLEPDANALVTQLFAVIHDESDAYMRAQRAIEQSDMTIVRSGAITTRWIFADFREMADYLFDYFSLAADKVRILMMANLLGLRQDDKPLSIEDITRFWLLG